MTNEECEKQSINVWIGRSKCIGCGQALRKLGNEYLACKCMWIALKEKLDNEKRKS